MAGLLPVGEYTVTAGGYTSENYQITYGMAQFSVTARDIKLSITDNGKSGTIWTNSVTKEELGLTDTDYVVEGVLRLNKTEENTYIATGEKLSADFEWAENFAITRDGIDITKNFNLTYDIEVRLENSAFTSHASGINSTYNGAAQKLGTVTVDDDIEYTLEYKLGDSGEWVKEMPVATDAGSYTVYYRISAENYETYESRFTATIAKAANKITYTQHNAVTYNGEEHEFALDAAHFATTDGSAVQLVAGQTNIFTNAGQHTFKVYVPASKNYLAAEYTVTVTINKAQFEIEYTDYGTLTYDGAEHDFLLANFSVPYGATVQFAEDSAQKWQNAGDYKVKVFVEDGENWEGASREVTVTVNQATVNTIMGSNSLMFTYNGSEQYFLAGNKYTATYGTVMFKEQTSGTTAGNYQFVAYVDATNNYVGAELTVNVTIDKATYTKEYVEGLGSPLMAEGDILLGYNPETQSGKTLAEVALQSGFYWLDTDIEYVEGDNSYTAYYNADSDNYYNYELDIKFEALKEDITVTVGGVLEMDIDPNAGAINYFSNTAMFNAVHEGGAQFTELSLETFLQASGGNSAVGSTYKLTYTAKASEYDKYYNFNVVSNNPILKVKSVVLDNVNKTIEDALFEAQGEKTIRVIGNTAFAESGFYSGADYYTVKSGVTLFIPYEQADELGNNTYSEGGALNTSANKTLYFTLSIPEGITIENAGTITVGGYTGIKNASSRSQGAITGGYSQIDLAGTINNAGMMNVYGNIIGSGQVNVSAGGTVRERLEINDWRGGTIAGGSFLAFENKSSKVDLKINSEVDINPAEANQFPFKQYSLASITAKVVVEYGGKLAGIARIYTQEPDRLTDVDFVVVSQEGDDNGLILLKNTEGAFVSKTQKNGRVEILVHGGATGGQAAFKMTIKAEVSFLWVAANFDMKTGLVAFPITNGVDLILEDGDYSSAYGYKILPGATLELRNNANLTFTDNVKGIIVYTEDDITYCNNLGNPSSATEGTWELYPSGLADGKLIVGGGCALTIADGTIFGGIISGEAGAKVTVGNNVTLTAISYEGYGTGEKSYLPPSITFNYIVTSKVENVAQLKDEDGTLIDMVVGGTYTFNGSIWEQA